MYRTTTKTERICVTTLGPAIVGMDRATGARVWQYKSDSFVNYVFLAVTPDLVLAAGGKTLTALAYTTGAHLYTVQLPMLVGSFLYDAGQVILGGAGELACLDGATGKLLWHDGFSGFGHYACAIGVPGNAAHADRG